MQLKQHALKNAPQALNPIIVLGQMCIVTTALPPNIHLIKKVTIV